LKGILPPQLSFAHHCLYQHEQGVNADIMNGGCCDYAVMFDVGNYLMVSGHVHVPLLGWKRSFAFQLDYIYFQANGKDRFLPVFLLFRYTTVNAISTHLQALF
tara:strand:- start:5937 stop:6245 length:309 start_codon:yes stop_codon:yes gene_type:complete